MGRKARTKQGVPAPLTDSDIARIGKGGAGGKKTSSAKPDAVGPFKAKAGKGGAASTPQKAKAVKQKKRVKAVDVVDDDSDAEEALEQG